MPTKIAWKPFYSNLPPPALRGPGGFGELPPLKKNLKVAVKSTASTGAIATTVKAADGPSDEDVEYWFKIMQEKMTTRFSELRRAFRTLDEDASGSLDREEFKQVLVMFNLGIPDRVRKQPGSACSLNAAPSSCWEGSCLSSATPAAAVKIAAGVHMLGDRLTRIARVPSVCAQVMNKLIDLADFDGDGSINYAEFARIFTAENIHSMKQTLQVRSAALSMMCTGSF